MSGRGLWVLFAASVWPRCRNTVARRIGRLPRPDAVEIGGHSSQVGGDQTPPGDMAQASLAQSRSVTSSCRTLRSMVAR